MGEKAGAVAFVEFMGEKAGAGAGSAEWNFRYQ